MAAWTWGLSRSINSVAAFLIAGLLLGGCANPRDSENFGKNAAIDIARAYVAEHIPKESHVLTYLPFVVDRGENWLVTFIAPGEPRTGGVPEIAIDKMSLQVIRVTWAM